MGTDSGWLVRAWDLGSDSRQFDVGARGHIVQPRHLLLADLLPQRAQVVVELLDGVVPSVSTSVSAVPATEACRRKVGAVVNLMLGRFESRVSHLRSVILDEGHRSITHECCQQPTQAHNYMPALELYKWGDISREQYRAESREIEDELARLPNPIDVDGNMEKLAQFLRNVSSAWRQVTQEKRNKLARSLFESVWIESQMVLGVTPSPELEPFFDLQYSELSNDVLQWRPRPDSGPQDRLSSTGSAFTS